MQELILLMEIFLRSTVLGMEITSTLALQDKWVIRKRGNMLLAHPKMEQHIHSAVLAHQALIFIPDLALKQRGSVLTVKYTFVPSQDEQQMVYWWLSSRKITPNSIRCSYHALKYITHLLYFLFFKIAAVRKLEFPTTFKNLLSTLLRSNEVDLQSPPSLM